MRGNDPSPQSSIEMPAVEVDENYFTATPTAKATGRFTTRFTTARDLPPNSASTHRAQAPRAAPPFQKQVLRNKGNASAGCKSSSGSRPAGWRGLAAGHSTRSIRGQLSEKHAQEGPGTTPIFDGAASCTGQKLSCNYLVKLRHRTSNFSTVCTKFNAALESLLLLPLSFCFLVSQISEVWERRHQKLRAPKSPPIFCLPQPNVFYLVQTVVSLRKAATDLRRPARCSRWRISPGSLSRPSPSGGVSAPRRACPSLR